MEEKIIDCNRTDFNSTTVFHFANSLRPFIRANAPYYNNSTLFIDLKYNEAYTLDEIQESDLMFYEDANDEDFLGVAIIEELQY